MNVNCRIEEALASVTKNIWPLCCPYESQPKKYIVYNPENDAAESYADDEDIEWTQYMQVHFYTKSDYMDERKQIRKLLREAGFVVTDIDTLYEKDTKFYHLCFSCYIEEED